MATKTFTSDFFLKPLNYANLKSGPATWHADTDSAIHDLLDGYRTEPVAYTRKRLFDGKYQDCKVVKEDDSLILLPGDGSRYSVTKLSTHNRINDEKANDTNHCVLCQEYEKNHTCIPCGHVVSCTRCTEKLESMDHRCPLCRVPYNQVLRIFY